MSLQVNLQKSLRDFTLNVAFEADRDVMGILGASGCGKSMTLKCIAGIETPDTGRIVLNGRVLFDSKEKINLPPQKRRVGYLFQNYALFPNMTVRQNIGAGLFLPREDKQSRLTELLRLFQLEGLGDRYPRELSGGQQQRVALARSLAAEPEMLMLDEPFSALDEYLKENLQNEFIRLLDSYEGDILLVTHSRDEIYCLCNEAVVLQEGQVAIHAPVKELFRAPGNLAAARLSGCKNLSAIEKLGDRTLRALEWGVVLETEEEIPEGIGYVGIRAHDLVPAGAGTGKNWIPCHNPRLQEALFEQVLLFTAREGQREALWWKGSKEYWQDEMKEQVPEGFYLPPECLMLLRES